MAPLSVLPGRIRFWLPSLIGQDDMCRLIESELASIEGIRCASANSRTGRILVKFDEELVTGRTVAGLLEEVKVRCHSLSNTDTTRRPLQSRALRGRGEDASSLPLGQLLLELLAHTLLPKPLDLLLPAAASVLKR
jgi:hypothetical protein